MEKNKHSTFQNSRVPPRFIEGKTKKSIISTFSAPIIPISFPSPFVSSMVFTLEQIQGLAYQHYNLPVTVKPLPGEIDLNFLVTTPDGTAYNLKIANPNERPENLAFQNEMMKRLTAAGLETPRIQATVEGEEMVHIPAPDGSLRMMRLLSWIDGRCLADVNPHTPELLEKLGAFCGKLSAALEGYDHPAAHRFMKWDPAQAAWTEMDLDKIADPRKREIAHYFLQLFKDQEVEKLRKSVIYGDANDYNVLVAGDFAHLRIPGVIDFGDAVYSETIHELGIAAAYAAMHKSDPLTAIFQIVKGYHAEYPLTEAEAAALFPMIGARLLISVVCSAINLTENPENIYLQISDAPAWDLLEKLRLIHPSLVHATIRHACGWEPFAQNAEFHSWVAENFETFKSLVPVDLRGQDATWLDLSVGSQDLGNFSEVADIQVFTRKMEFFLASEGKLAGMGGYMEVRPIYTTDAYAIAGNEGPEWRTVHVGFDVFMAAGNPVYAPIAGTVHSFADNDRDRDYGPTIVLEHRVSEQLTFYTLYGHLARTSLPGLQKGMQIAAGQQVGTIGPPPENGNWPPHLHFQVILDMMDKEGDYPGVAFPRHRAIWSSLCPDPWMLVTGGTSPVRKDRSIEEILDYRSWHLGKNLSVSYAHPLKILRGMQQYLLDDTGRRYLDTVNNVAHVGHEHPRVVRAGQRQMAVLNTNTRYLHENIIQFTEDILKTFPPGLEVAFIVNSGSEANELAMRLAKNYTQQKDMIVVEVGYHGNTQGCVDISSYKFDGPGGKGRPENVQVVPIPDAYRGLYRGNTPETATQYVSHLEDALKTIQAAGRGPAAFICESVISCGGQVTLPPGYLSQAAAAVRRAGGLLISDEVQTGCGRHGQHFWAFEEHGVVPDIVTVGKPIGNGHPLGVVVTTRAIAEAFANGMEYFNTFGGNPVSCAIGSAVLQVIREEGLQQNALETGQYLSRHLHELASRFPIIGDVRGQGLFLGFELVKDPITLEPAAAQTAYLANRMRELGILMSTDGPYHNVLKIKPPMVFGKRDADFLMEMLEKVTREEFMRVG
jgi:4-aminobutyrate aminotransferase-like enzyme/Ser/Thr protein kinase RdoA (MazF antagonist)